MYTSSQYAKRFKEAGFSEEKIVYANYLRDDGTLIYNESFLDQRHAYGVVKSFGYTVYGPAFTEFEMMDMVPTDGTLKIMRMNVDDYRVIYTGPKRTCEGRAKTFADAMANLVLTLVKEEIVKPS